jgi:hypothetical protein
MANDYNGVQRGTLNADLRNQITKLGLVYRLMTQFTAFVAVEERTVTTEGGQPRRIEVPVEMPTGVSHEGVFGSGNEVAAAAHPQAMALGAMRSMPRTAEFRRKPTGSYLPTPSTASVDQRQEAVAERDAAKVVVADRNRRPGAPKLHPDLAAALASPTTAKAAFLVNGKAEIRVYLNLQDAPTLQALRALGLEVVRHETANQLVIGRIDLTKLQALSEHAAVRYISPR